MIMVSVTSFVVRFLFFMLKIIGACLFVMILQVQVGEKSIEQWLEKGLKESAVSRYLTQTAMTSMEMLSQKLPALKFLTRDKNNQKKENVYHSFVEQQMQEVEEQINNNISEDDINRVPSASPVEKK